MILLINWRGLRGTVDSKCNWLIDYVRLNCNWKWCLANFMFMSFWCHFGVIFYRNRWVKMELINWLRSIDVELKMTWMWINDELMNRMAATLTNEWGNQSSCCRCHGNAAPVTSSHIHVIFGSHQGSCLTSFLCHFCVIFVSFLCHFHVILVPLKFYYGVILVSF